MAVEAEAQGLAVKTAVFEFLACEAQRVLAYGEVIPREVLAQDSVTTPRLTGETRTSQSERHLA